MPYRGSYLWRLRQSVGHELDAEFADMEVLPAPLHPPTHHALGLLSAYLDSGAFQVG